MEKQTNICQEQAFNKVYKAQAQSLRNFMFFKTKDTDASYDLVQEAFLKLWQNCAKVTPEKAKSYLFTTANNLFLIPLLIKRYNLISDQIPFLPIETLVSCCLVIFLHLG